MLAHAVQDIEDGVYFRYRLDGSLFDLQRLKAKRKCLHQLTQEAVFLDYCAPRGTQEQQPADDAQQILEASRAFDLTISLSNTEVLHQPARNSTPLEPNISIDNIPLANVDNFNCQGSVVSDNGSLDKEITSGISKASHALWRLRTKVLNHRNICLSTNLKVYRTVVLTFLLYGRQTWTLYYRHVKQLENIHVARPPFHT